MPHIVGFGSMELCLVAFVTPATSTDRHCFRGTTACIAISVSQAANGNILRQSRQLLVPQESPLHVAH
jgi:hypothetical protein